MLAGTRDLRVGLPGLAWALVPCMGGLRRLACRVTGEVSADLFLNGEVLDAASAHAKGLLDRVLDEDADLEQLCRDMREFSPEAVLALRDLRLRRHGPIDSVVEARLFGQPFASGECQRRLRALLSG